MTLESLFRLALEKPPAARATFLDQACAGDAALRRRVEMLLQAHDHSVELVEPSSLEGTSKAGHALGPQASGSDLPRLAPELNDSFTDLRPPVPKVNPPLPKQYLSAIPAPAPKVRYFGDYELLEEIARGGMGVVYKARQVSLNRVVALKMILTGQLASEADVKRFHAEAESAGNLDHPHIVPIFEVSEHEGQHFFSMKLIEGGSLTGQIPRLVKDPEAAVRLLIKVAQAVHHAHQRGLLHRDLKPGNILLDAHQEPHVTDFGLAKRVEGGGTLTISGAIVGTPGYIAPEQAAAKKDLTTAADVYSLGAILYELLTGRPPFKEDTPLDTLLKVMVHEPEWPRMLNPMVDRDLETICLKCLDKEPQRRYGSALALAEDLERWLVDEPILARRSGTRERLVKWARRKPAEAALWGLVALALVLGLLGMAWQWGVALAARHVAQEKAEAAEAARDSAEQAQRAEAAERENAVYETYVAKIALAAAKVDRGAFGNVEELLDSCPPRLRHWEWGRLKKLCHQELRLLTHPGMVSRVAFTSNGGRLVTVGEDKIARVWDTQNGMEISALTGHKQPITAVGLAASSRIVVTAGADHVAKVWDGETGRLLREFEGTRVTISQDGRRVLTATEDKKAHVWDTATGQEIAVLTSETSKRSGAWTVFGPFSPDGRRVLTGQAEGDPARSSQVSTLTIWDAPTGKEVAVVPGIPQLESASFSPSGRRLLVTAIDTSALLSGKRGDPAYMLREFQAPDSKVYLKKVFNADNGKELTTLRAPVFDAFAFSPDGKHLCTGTAIWDVETGKEVVALRGPVSRVRAVVFAGDGKRVLTGAEDGTARVWDAETGRELAACKGHTAGVAAVALASDGRRVATGSLDRTARLWDLKNQGTTPLKGHQLLVASATFSPSGRRIVTGSWDRTARVWDADSGKELANLDHESGSVTFAAFSQDGSRVFTASRDLLNPAVSAPMATTWDTETRRQIATVKVSQVGFGDRCLAFSPEGKRLITAARDATARIWNVETGREIASLKGHTESIYTVAFAQDDDRAFTASEDGTVRVWSLATGQETARLANLGKICSLAVSPDGTRVLIASLEGFEAGDKIWEVKTGRVIPTLPGRRGPFKAVAFSPDGRRVAVASTEGGPVRIGDAVDGRELVELKGHARPVSALSFSPDGKRLLTGSDDRTAKLWDARTGRELLSFEHEAPVTALAWSPDGQRLLTAGADGTVILWMALAWE